MIHCGWFCFIFSWSISSNSRDSASILFNGTYSDPTETQVCFHVHVFPAAWIPWMIGWMIGRLLSANPSAVIGRNFTSDTFISVTVFIGSSFDLLTVEEATCPSLISKIRRQLWSEEPLKNGTIWCNGIFYEKYTTIEEYNIVYYYYWWNILWKIKCKFTLSHTGQN